MNMSRLRDFYHRPDLHTRELISVKNGLVIDSHFPAEDRGTVVLVQDLHGHFQIQVSIYNIITELIKRYRLSLVAVEGMFGELKKLSESKTTDHPVLEGIYKACVGLGVITGTDLARMMSPDDIAFWGADDRVLHGEQTESYRHTLKVREDNLKYWAELEAIAEAVKEKAYSEELLDLERRISANNNEDSDFASYVEYLLSLMRERKLERRRYPNFDRMARIVRLESTVDFATVDIQRDRIIDRLRVALAWEQLNDLSARVEAFRDKEIGQLTFHAYLKEVARREGIPGLEEDYGQLLKYISYLELFSRIDSVRLDGEIEEIEEAIRDTLFTDDNQRQIGKISSALKLLKNAFELRLINTCYRRYADRRDELSSSAIADALTGLARAYGVDCRLDPDHETIDTNLSVIERYYTLAEKRNRVLVDSTRGEMARRGAETAALVAGGFHTEGITRLLREQAVAYVVITPSATDPGESKP